MDPQSPSTSRWQRCGPVEILLLLGVLLDRHLLFSPHVTEVLAQAAQSTCALQVLKAAGLSDSSLHTVCRATLVTCLLYAAPSWWGEITAVDKGAITGRPEQGYPLGYVPTPPSPSRTCVCRLTAVFSPQYSMTEIMSSGLSFRHPPHTLIT